MQAAIGQKLNLEQTLNEILIIFAPNMVKIGHIELGDFPLLLAPMEDVSDPPVSCCL